MSSQIPTFKDILSVASIWIRQYGIVGLLLMTTTLGCQVPKKNDPHPAKGIKRTETYKIISLEKEFVEFWSKAKSKSFEERLELWDSIIEKNHQDFYDSLVWAKKSRADWKSRKQEKLAKYFEFYEKNYETILSNFKEFQSVLGKQIAKYQQTFPDAKFVAPIYAVPSGGSFNGKAGDHYSRPNETVLAFGIDMIIERKDDPDVLYAHELFHVYHLGILDLTEQKARNAKLTLPLWLEGFATYVSGEFNPNADDGTLLLDSDLLKVKSEVPWLAKSFLKVADQKAWDQKDITAYLSWFGLDKHRPRADMPARTGYLLGLEVARTLAKKHTLNEMVHWSVDEAHDRVLEALNEMKR